MRRDLVEAAPRGDHEAFGAVLRQLLRVCLALLVVGCSATSSSSAANTTAPATTAGPPPPASSTPTAFPTEAFAAITEDPVPADLAAKLQSILDQMPAPSSLGAAGVSATLMSARGTWRGVKGTADGVDDVTIDTQFSIASTTKAVTAAQVMQLVEAGKLGLDDPAADHLPADLDFDTNGATVRDLLGHRSGIPDYVDVVGPKYDADPRRFWTPAELLAAVPADRKPAAAESEYANVNYVLLGLVIEEVTGRPFVEVLRDGVLDIDGVERLIYQPAEVPTDPIAIDGGRSIAWFESMGGFLPSLALTSDGPAAAMASDSVSLGRWWRALCAGEIVSRASLTEMLPTDDWYGLGLGVFQPGTVGHFGSDAGGASLAGCVPESGLVFAVLLNRGSDLVSSDAAQPLIRAMEAQ
jgi:D-alanyl-D-alanine carboxypeptidase